MALSDRNKTLLLHEISVWESFYSGSRLAPSGQETCTNRNLTPLLQCVLLRRAGEPWWWIDSLIGEGERYGIELVDSYEDLDIGRMILAGKGYSFAEVCEVLDWVSGDEPLVDKQHLASGRKYIDCLKQSEFALVEICAAIEVEYPSAPLSKFIGDLPDWITGIYVPRKSPHDSIEDQSLRSVYVDRIRLAGTHQYPLSSRTYNRLIEMGVIAGPGAQSIAKYFGSWRRACSEAGIQAFGQDGRIYQSKWSEDELVGFVVECMLSTGDFPTISRYTQWAKSTSGVPSVASVRNRLGSWHDVSLRVKARLKELGSD